MVVLDFERDPSQLTRGGQDPLTAHLWDLEERLLRQPVRLVLGDATLLDSWPVSLFYLAGLGLRILESLPETGRAELEIPLGSLKLSFEFSADTVRVREELHGAEGQADYDELLHVWQRFSTKAREYLLSEFPGLADHPHAGGWFRQDPNWRNPEWE